MARLVPILNPTSSDLRAGAYEWYEGIGGWDVIGVV